MNIIVATGRGTGRTLLSSFDAALKDAGVLNYNLITLSSIIPPGAIIGQDAFQAPPEDYGNRLYVVKADMRSDISGQAIGAGIGWYQFQDGRGVFVEHELAATSEVRAYDVLRTTILTSLTDLCLHRSVPVEESRMHVALITATVSTSPACVLVLAVYESVTWRGHAAC